jgi:hypothetical protein
MVFRFSQEGHCNCGRQSVIHLDGRPYCYHHGRSLITSKVKIPQSYQVYSLTYGNEKGLYKIETPLTCSIGSICLSLALNGYSFHSVQFIGYRVF